VIYHRWETLSRSFLWRILSSIALLCSCSKNLQPLMKMIPQLNNHHTGEDQTSQKHRILWLLILTLLLPIMGLWIPNPMPPPPRGPWSADWIKCFEQWKDGGKQPKQPPSCELPGSTRAENCGLLAVVLLGARDGIVSLLEMVGGRRGEHRLFGNREKPASIPRTA
jgi:hypothetical protein